MSTVAIAHSRDDRRLIEVRDRDRTDRRTAGQQDSRTAQDRAAGTGTGTGAMVSQAIGAGRVTGANLV